MAIRILEIDRPTNKGTVYPREVIEKAIANHIARLGRNQMGIYTSVDGKTIIGMADDLRIEDGYLVADVKLVDTWVNEMAEKNLREFCIRPIGHGLVNPMSGIIEEGYAFHGLVIRMNPLKEYEKTDRIKKDVLY